MSKSNPTLKTDQNTSLFQNLEEISAVTFHKIKFKDAYYLMDKDYKEGKKYSVKAQNEFRKGWIKLYDEYFELMDDSTFRKDIKDKTTTLHLLCTITRANDVIEILEFIDIDKEYMPKDVYIETITSIGESLKRLNKRFNFDITKNLKENIDSIKRVIGGLETRYKVQKKQEKKSKKADLLTYYEIKSSIEDVFGRNLPEYINMLQWVAYQKKYQTKVKQAKIQSNV